jgi:hypothetical protein
MDAGQTIQLTAVLVVGPQRRRGQRSLDALCRQSAVDRMEILLYDLGTAEHRPLAAAEGASVETVRMSSETALAAARADGARRARAPVVAYIEDHCYAHVGWAEALIEAHRGPWAAVSYAFTNPNPETWLSRAAFMADYGPWHDPLASGPSRALNGVNVSYKRDVLLAQGELLPRLFAPDQVFLETLARGGRPMYIEGRALAAHENVVRFGHHVRANMAYCRLHAATRAEVFGWSRGKRLLYAALVPVISPWLRLWRFLEVVWPRRDRWRAVLEALPDMIVVYVVGAVAAGIGYGFGPGDAERRMTYYDLETTKSTSPA